MYWKVQEKCNVQGLPVKALLPPKWGHAALGDSMPLAWSTSVLSFCPKRMGSDLFIIQVGTPKSRRGRGSWVQLVKWNSEVGFGVHSDPYHGLICLSGEETKAQGKKKKRHRGKSDLPWVTQPVRAGAKIPAQDSKSGLGAGT